MTTHYLREMLGNITQKEFAKEFNIPYRTVQNWDSRDCMPQYVWNLIYSLIYKRIQYNQLKEEFEKLNS